MTGIREDFADLVRLLVDEPNEVDVVQHEHRGGCDLELHVDYDDLGKVIGRQGRTARALRALLLARGQQDNKRYELEILED